MEQKKISVQNAFVGRTDDYVDSGTDYSNSVQETWVHKQVVKVIGDTEDDFILDEKPILTNSVDLQKQINESAKGTDLKSLIAQVLRTGDDSILHVSNGVYADITGMPTDSITAHNAIIAGQKALDSLPDDLKEKGVDSLINMTKDELKSYIESIVNSQNNVGEQKQDAKEGDN